MYNAVAVNDPRQNDLDAPLWNASSVVSSLTPQLAKTSSTTTSLVRIFPNKSEEFLKTICSTPSNFSKRFFEKRDRSYRMQKPKLFQHQNRMFFFGEQQKISWKGLLYIKLEKSASSTLAGINYRIAAEAFEGDSICESRGLSHLWNTRLICHSSYQVGRIGGSNCSTRGSYEKKCDYFSCIKPQEAFLWTMVRSPNSRALSEFFYFSGQVLWNDTDATMRSLIQWHLNGSEDKFYHYRLVSSNPAKQQNMTEAIVYKIMQRLDFIGVVERLDDSLCVLGLLLNLDPSLLVHVTDSKVQGNYAPVEERYGRIHSTNQSSRICEKKSKPFKTREMKEFYQSSAWEEKSRYARMLYDAANKSLDATIDHTIGRDRFVTYKLEYQHLLKLATETCQNETILCQREQRTDIANEVSCYHEDSGCGYRCLNKLFSNRTRRYS